MKYKINGDGRFGWERLSYVYKANIRSKLVFENPGGGTSTIKTIDDTKLVYIRGTSNLYIDHKDIIDTYNVFKGKTCTTTDLREFRPEVFDSKRNGHSCNCTFLFTIFNELNLIKGGIKGTGIKGAPFYVKVK